MKKQNVKKYILTTFAVTALGVTSAQANEVFYDLSYTSGLSGVSSEAVENLRDCLDADMEIAASKAIRACTKAYRASIPNKEIRSRILTNRGLLQLSAGKYEKAARDFKMAGKLNETNELANLGKGYAALMVQDLTAATELFSDCKNHSETAPLAMYGLAMAKEMSGDMDGALSYYNEAASLRPNWTAPKNEIRRVKSAS